jgi:hypothetical protein
MNLAPKAPCLAILGILALACLPASGQHALPVSAGHASVWVQAAAGSAALHLQAGPGGLSGLLLDHPFPQADSRLVLRPVANTDRDTHVFMIDRTFGLNRPTEDAGVGRIRFQDREQAEFQYVLDGRTGCMRLRRPIAPTSVAEAAPAADCTLRPELAQAMVAPPLQLD